MKPIEQQNAALVRNVVARVRGDRDIVRNVVARYLVLDELMTEYEKNTPQAPGPTTET